MKIRCPDTTSLPSHGFAQPRPLEGVHGGMLDAGAGGRDGELLMSSTAAKIFVASAPPLARIRICGRGAVDRARDFDQMVRCLIEGGVRNIFIDLAGCVLLDSTFIGALAGLAEEKTDDQPRIRFHLVNAPNRILDGLANLEVLDLMTVGGDFTTLSDLPEIELPLQNVTRKEAGELCLQAHRTLMDLSPTNRERFQSLVRMLSSELDGNGPR